LKYSPIMQCSPYELAAALHNEEYFAFLDSSRTDAEQGRYSILAWRPRAVLRTKDENPFPAVERLLPSKPNSGVIGYFSYDVFRFLEQYKGLKAVDDLALPDCCLMVYENILVFDHETQKWTGDLESVPRAIRERESFACSIGNAEAGMTRRQYMAGVEKALEYIAAGDIYQVNLSQRFSHSFKGSPFALFSALRTASPSFYGAYLNCGDHAVISSSPELFLRQQGREIETRPIKGTRPRGRDAEEDQRLKLELINSAKEAAELTMIVDLERNDLGRVCEYGSVEVAQHRYVEELPALFHTVSTVRGRLRNDAGTVDLLRATLPGGSISGCPKIRAIEIIDELEPVRRHVYTGAIGFMGAGDLRLSIAIRTMTVTQGRVYYHVGSGIVADSDPAREYEETLHKAAGMQSAIELCGG
jgi:para-aminobenzoate synthetase component I